MHKCNEIIEIWQKTSMPIFVFSPLTLELLGSTVRGTKTQQYYYTHTQIQIYTTHTHYGILMHYCVYKEGGQIIIISIFFIKGLSELMLSF